ncbi:MAG: hypothetical protein HY681_12245 [Chloroflexi bacterium]|nr:hypothetical protein [Chloroflexota bacterium]
MKLEHALVGGFLLYLLHELLTNDSKTTGVVGQAQFRPDFGRLPLTPPEPTSKGPIINLALPASGPGKQIDPASSPTTISGPLFQIALPELSGIKRYLEASGEQVNLAPPPVSKPQLVLPQDIKWLDVVPHPSVELILGARGSGKTALGYRQLELSRWKLAPYVLGVPKQAARLLPDWISIVEDPEDIPHNAIVLVDEAYVLYHSRGSMKAGREEISQVVNLSRQRNQTFIFVTQEARQIDRNIASVANVIVLKEPGMLQHKFERPELNELVSRAKEAFEAVHTDRRPWSYVYSPDSKFMGLLENSLPTFWKPGLSHLFATGDMRSTRRVSHQMALDEKVRKARELREANLSYRRIGEILGVNEATAYNYVNGYPYRRR